MALIQSFINLMVASLREVRSEYFNLITTDEESGIVRERVFCYEFYHRMRCNMDETLGITLNGEVSKQSHSSFRREHRKTPDFIFHQPGTMDNNLIICEVKGKLFEKSGKRADLTKDFETLQTFVSDYQYKAGVFVLYNHSFNELIDFFSPGVLSSMCNQCDDKIFIITIPRAGIVEGVLDLKSIKNFPV
jgi:hypothetical protein